PPSLPLLPYSPLLRSESKALPRVRVTFGWVFAAFGLVASALPLVLPGTAAVAGAAGSAMFFVISVALLGPRLVHLMTGLLAAPLDRKSTRLNSSHVRI